MAKRKKRNAVTLVSLLLALAALIGVYYWYSNYKEAQDSKTEDASQTIALATVDTTQVSSLHVIMKDADLTLVKQEDSWISQNDPDRPINQNYVNSMLNAIGDIKADRIIMEKPENLADYGLAAPAASIEATVADGSKVTVKIGNEAGASEGYYGMVNDDGIVYMLPTEMGTAFQYSDAQMTAVAVGPEIAAENIRHILVDNRDAEDYELQYKDGSQPDNTGNNLYSWEILRPYGEGYTADSSKVSEVQANYTTFDFSECVDYKGTDLSKYGLDNPAAIIDIGYLVTRTEALATPEPDPNTGENVSEKTYYDPYEYKLYVGNKDESGGHYYVMVDGSSSVYTMSATNIDKMLTMDVFGMLNPYVMIPNIANVDQITATVQGTEYKMNIDYTTTKKDDGTEETIGTYYYNGTKVEEEAFKSLYQKLVSATYDAENKEDVNTAGVVPYLTMTYHVFGDQSGTLTASFLPYNDSFYLVQKDADHSFLVDKRKVDAIAAAVSTFTGKAEE